jgi:predicted PurR-regulated permease PerM
MKNQETKLSISTGTFIRFWLVIIGFIAVIAGIFVAKSALITIAVSFFLALVLNRPVSFLARHFPGHSRALATLASYLIVIAIIVLLFFNVIPIFVHQISTFVGNAPELIREIQSRNNGIELFLQQHHLAAQYNAWLANISQQLGDFANQIGGSAVGMITALAGGLVSVIFTAVLTFLMLVEGPFWEKKFWSVAYRDQKKRARHQKVAKKMYDVVSGYITGQAMVAAISATLTAAVVWILSVTFTDIDPSLVLPSWMAIFILTFVPMFGATIGGLLVAALLALFAWPAAVIYLVFFLIEQQFENNFTSPKIQSKRLNMSALVVLASILIGLNVAGVLGVLVAIPVAGCVMVLLREFLRERRSRKIGSVAGGDFTPNEDISIVFVEEDRKFTRPHISRKSHKVSRKSDDASTK